MYRNSIARLSVCFACLLAVGIVGAQETTRSPASGAPKSIESAVETPEVKSTLLQFNFTDAPWPMVLEWIADKAELSLDLADEPDGEFNYIDDKQHTVTEALDVMNGYLLPRGYVLLRRDQFLVSMKIDNPVLPNLVPTVPASQLDKFGDNELLRIVVPVEGFSPQQVAGQVTEILGPKGVASPLDSSGALVLQGFGKSLREAVALLAEAKAPPADDELIFRSFPLQHIAAIDAERQVQNLFGLGSNPFQASMQRREAWRRSQRGGERGNEGRENSTAAAGPTPLVENFAMNMKVSSLRQTNSLLVTATPAAIALVENILQTIDVPLPADQATQFTGNTPSLRVYKFENADEDDVAETIDAVIPGVVINEDGRHNAIHVLATPAEHVQVEELISIIDSGGVGDGVEVIPLTRTDPIMMCEMLSTLFENEDRDDRPVITPGFQNRSLIVRGSSAQMAEIRKALASFNEGGGIAGAGGEGGRFRRLPLGGSRDAQRIARTVKDLLDTNQQFDNRIRVVVPADKQDTATERTTGELRSVPLDEEEPQASRPPADKLVLAAYEAELGGSVSSAAENRATNEVAAPDNEEPQAATRDKPARLPRVTIEVQGSDLLMYSNDEVALDKVEQTVRDLVRQMPTRTRWTVFFLRAAPADTTAQTLVDLLRSDAQSEAVIGAADDYTPFGGLAEQTIQIVPDLRTNSLFVSGTDEQIARAEQFLEFLDTNDPPGSLRDREPRAIPVKYADVHDVAQIVSELYKDYMVDPLAAVRSGGDRRDRDSQAQVAKVLANEAQSAGLRPSGIQLTLSVDEASSTLLVSCNDKLFEQIRQLVRQRDEAAEGSQPVTQVLRIKPESAEQIRSVLGGLGTEMDEQASRDRNRGRSRDDRRR